MRGQELGNSVYSKYHRQPQPNVLDQRVVQMQRKVGELSHLASELDTLRSENHILRERERILQLVGEKHKYREKMIVTKYQNKWNLELEI